MSQQVKSLAVVAVAVIPAIVTALLIAYFDDWRYRTGTFEIPVLVFVLMIALLAKNKRAIRMVLIWFSMCVGLPAALILASKLVFA
ncbi:hypothetical protein G3A56_09075 [Rhizobium oryzihabitans]|uniref:Uncharacterized protein n=1 Tax=Rhizobium oryzihabitans TaxID=2267833 RepID=A0A7L5BH26_9HYPH|nr:hypothetical protein [Rhizobium oryzihabitans]QIB38122.1 hypothetical protein G3A56_09075 [Rhizobium oryzihabitans]